MQDASRFVFAASHFVAMATFICPGLWKRFPICFLMILISSITAFTYEPESKDWVRNVYMNVEPLAVALRLGAAIEAIHKMAGGCKQKTLLIFGLTSFGVSVVATIWAIEPGSSVHTFVQYRLYIQVMTSAIMIGAVVFFASQRLWRWSLTTVHFSMLFVFLLKQAAYSVLFIRGLWGNKSQWQAADWPGLLISSLCLLSWSILAISCSRRDSSAHPTPSSVR